MRWRFSVFWGDTVQMQAETDNGGERKTRFVPRSLVQGTMEGPRERGIEQHCVKRGGSKQANTNRSTCWKTTVFGELNFLLLLSFMSLSFVVLAIIMIALYLPK